MLNGRVYWSKSQPLESAADTHKCCINVKLEKLLECNADEDAISPNVHSDNINKDPSISMPDWELATSSHANIELHQSLRRHTDVVRGIHPNIDVACHSPKHGSNVIIVPPLSIMLRYRQFIPCKPTCAPVKPPPFQLDSGAIATTIDLDDDMASAPLLNHISELVDDIVEKTCL